MIDDKKIEVGTAPVAENPILTKYPWLPFASVVVVIGVPLGLAALFSGKKGR